VATKIISEYSSFSKIASMALGELDKMPVISLASFLLFVEQLENSTHKIIKTHENILYSVFIDSIKFLAFYIFSTLLLMPHMILILPSIGILIILSQISFSPILIS